MSHKSYNRILTWQRKIFALLPWVLEYSVAVQGAVLWRLQRSSKHFWRQKFSPEGFHLWVLAAIKAMMECVPESLA
eukprot:3643383-Pyramimonas_sp.AAC.1